jgi:hypothetical protein
MEAFNVLNPCGAEQSQHGLGNQLANAGCHLWG